MNTIHAISNARSTGHPRGKRGSVLLLTIMLVSLLLLVILSFAGYVRMEARGIADRQALLTARKNAELGIHLAISRLQVQTGPDQRVTAKADIELPPGVSSALSNVENYWNAKRNRHWTGVWYNGETKEYNAENPAETNPDPERLSWLVGVESGQQVDPTTVVDTLEEDSTPHDLLEDSNGKQHVMLVSPDSNLSGSQALGRAVTAPRVSMGTSVDGHYAWWVGDEGVKARADLIDPYAGSTASSTEGLRRITTAQRMGIEAMTTDGQEAMAVYSNIVNTVALDKVNYLDEFGYLVDSGSAESFSRAINSKLHDVTLHSKGVLADVKHGGLKHDLSYILGQRNMVDMQKAIDAVYDGVSVNDDGTRNLIQQDITPLAKVPDSAKTGGKNDPTDPPGIFGYTPSWEHLWSFYNMGNGTGSVATGVMNGLGQAVPRLHTKDQHGIHPILISGKVFYELDFDSQNKINIIMRPLVVLANPYSVDLAPATYTVKYYVGRDLELLSLERAGTSEPSAAEASSGTSLASIPNGGVGKLVFEVNSGVIPAGEALVYTIDGKYTMPDSESGQESAVISLENDFNADDSHVLVYETGATLPSSSDPSLQTYAVLFSSNTGLRVARLYLGYDRSIAWEDGQDQTLLQFVRTHLSSQRDDSEDVYFVFPTRSDKKGGGEHFNLFDSGYTGNQQVALFLQQNYRTNFIDGFHSYTDRTHLLQWARGITKKGADGNETFFQAHLLGLTDQSLDGTSFNNVQWGPLNTGTQTSEGTAAPSELHSLATFRNILYDIPSQDVPISSIAQLQHLNVNAYIDTTSISTKPHWIPRQVQAWQVNYPVGNSYPNPGVAREQIIDNIYSGYHYDGSYIYNEIFWDRFFFSTYPADKNFNFQSDKLVNSRFARIQDVDEIPYTNNPDEEENGRLAAEHFWLEGAFNVNSTSIDAWKAMFSSLRGVNVSDASSSSNLTGPFVRTVPRLGSADESKTANHPNAWEGFRNLSQDEIADISEEMVKQVRLRGPFLSMADFVNRELILKSDDSDGLGLKGAMQSAIDAVINQKDDIDPLFRVDISNGKDWDNRYADTDFEAQTVIDGFPGYLLQADVLSSLGQNMSARSDTFRIRAYGDVNPEGSSDVVQARVWCEAIVQRTPDYMDGDSVEPVDDPTVAVNTALGRRFKIISFRWLNPEEI